MKIFLILWIIFYGQKEQIILEIDNFCPVLFCPLLSPKCQQYFIVENLCNGLYVFAYLYLCWLFIMLTIPLHCLKCTVFYEIRSKVATQFVTWDHTPRSNQLPPLRAGMVLEFFLGNPRYHESLTWKFQDCTTTFDSVS